MLLDARKPGVDRDANVFGNQDPRVLISPPSQSSAGAEAVELASSFGLTLDPWQRLVLERSLAERAGGKWASFEVGLCVPRQNGKGTILEARELAGLFLFGERLIVHSAHEFKTAKEAMRRLEFLLAESGEPYRANRSHGEEGLELKNGARVMFQTRTKAGGRGLSGDLVILDEAMILSPDAIQALMPTLSARPNPQIWYTGSAVDQQVHANGHVFAGVRRRALDGESPRLCYLEWSCEPGADPKDPKQRGRANPGMGYRISSEYIDDEYEALKHNRNIFEVERLGIGDWPTLLGSREPVIVPEAWQQMRNNAPNFVGPRTIALERTQDRRTWVIAAAQRTADGRIHAEIGRSSAMSDSEALAAVLEIVTAWDPAAAVIASSSSAAELAPALIKAGIEPVMVSANELADACGGFLNAALDGRLSHSDQPVLNNAVNGAVKRDIAGGSGRFAWDRDTSGSPAELFAVTLAHWSLLKFGVVTKLPAPPLMDTSSHGSHERDFDSLSAAF